MRLLLPAIILAVGLILAPVLFYTLPLIFPDLRAGGGGDFEVGNGSAVDSVARIEIQREQIRVDQIGDRLAEINTKLSELEQQIASAQMGGGGDPGAVPAGVDLGNPKDLDTLYEQVVLIADRRNVNRGLTVASPRFLIDLLGAPRADLSDNCQSMTNPRLRDLLTLGEVGPVRVNMLRPAAESLGRVFEKIRDSDPYLFERIDTAGALCVRRIRGSQNSVSSHAFGLSLDLNINGKLDTLGDGRTQLGLTIIADFFKAEGWIWGAGFSREDSMHFEVSQEIVERWRSEGKI